MDQSDDEKIKERARLRARAKAQKKRKEEKELKRYKETNAEYQKKINDTRTEYGLKKKKVQKTMGSFFATPSQ